MTIGGVTLNGRLLLAPMAGVTDAAFRHICAMQGAAMTTTEMVSSKALCYGDKKTEALLRCLPEDRPAAVQIFGHEPDTMAEAARRAIAISGAEILDINMGCPVGKIAGNEDGCALMRAPETARAIIEAVVAAVPCPVTVKFRKGWDKGHVNAVEFARMCQDAGAAAGRAHGHRPFADRAVRVAEGRAPCLPGGAAAPGLVPAGRALRRAVQAPGRPGGNAGGRAPARQRSQTRSEVMDAVTSQEELSLLRRAQSGDSAAFEAIVRAHEATVYRLALRQLGSREDAEDAAQEVFLKAYTGLQSFRGDSKLSVWLYRITSNVCIDLLRRRRETVSLSVETEDGGSEELELPDARFDPAALAERRDLRERIGAALSALPPEAREILLLRELGGESYEEIAQTLQLDIGTVKSRIFRARKKLCALLEGNFSGDSASKGKEGGVRA